jgi:hypothetical protein
VIDIVGLDRQADGGTHVAATGEIGRVRVVKTESKAPPTSACGSRWTCERRARRRLRRAVRPRSLPDLVERPRSNTKRTSPARLSQPAWMPSPCLRGGRPTRR